MAPRSASTSAQPEKPSKKTKSSSSGGAKKKKLTAFNKFMQTEMARLKETQPEISHQERFKLATTNWKNAPENPKPSTSS
ncbi:uncharacterized protein ARMOST_09426 [Armillaria ostoyae]|uniref:YABBY protein C-terminal domain-containing protein n=1 Tax=Armillaria ostoyae TaxID=47428 RepID=A0A284RBG7_ARMOS|nr:uncharacterized protein ARMOST_09426 [Armillaria ostoyae]